MNFLNKSLDEMLSTYKDLDKNQQTILIKLEECLYNKENDAEFFENDDLYADDREFLSKFSLEEISNFKSLQDSLRGDKSNISR